MRIVTWNINSLRLRLPLLKKLTSALTPDVICLQETKVPDELFPADAPGRLGFPFVAFRGMKGYNGVAVLSRRPIEVVSLAPDWCARIAQCLRLVGWRPGASVRRAWWESKEHERRLGVRRYRRAWCSVA